MIHLVFVLNKIKLKITWLFSPTLTPFHCTIFRSCYIDNFSDHGSDNPLRWCHSESLLSRIWLVLGWQVHVRFRSSNCDWCDYIYHRIFRLLRCIEGKCMHDSHSNYHFTSFNICIITLFFKFSTLLIVIFVLEVIVGVGGLLLKHKTDEFINKALTDTMKRYNTTNNTEITMLWDRVQNNVSNVPP